MMMMMMMLIMIFVEKKVIMIWWLDVLIQLLSPYYSTLWLLKVMQCQWKVCIILFNHQINSFLQPFHMAMNTCSAAQFIKWWLCFLGKESYIWTPYSVCLSIKAISASYWFWVWVNPGSREIWMFYKCMICGDSDQMAQNKMIHIISFTINSSHEDLNWRKVIPSYANIAASVTIFLKSRFN